MTSYIVVFLIIIAVYVYAKGKFKPAEEIGGNLPGPGKYKFNIVGESKYQENLESICGGRTSKNSKHLTTAVLILEDSNPFDDMAVRVDIDGQTVGYLSRSDARNYRKQLKTLGYPNLTCSCKAIIVGGWERTEGDRGHYGVKLDLPVR